MKSDAKQKDKCFKKVTKTLAGQKLDTSKYRLTLYSGAGFRLFSVGSIPNIKFKENKGIIKL